MLSIALFVVALHVTRYNKISGIWVNGVRDNEFAPLRSSRHRNAATRIIGGRDAPYGRFPYFATLEDGSSFRCGGSLIAPNVVLTAAHCAGSYLTHVGIGLHDLTDPFKPSERFPVKHVVIHPNYQILGRGTYATFDVALVQFDGVSSVDPLIINNNNNVPGSNDTELTVMGFGAINMNNVFPSVLQETTVKFVTNSLCESSGDPEKYTYAEKILPDMMCAVAPSRDACLGDSGGPMIIRGESPEQDIQVGVVSWGYECALPSYPGVYSRISHVYDWIDRTVCKMTMGVTHNGKVSGCFAIPKASAPPSSPTSSSTPAPRPPPAPRPQLATPSPTQTPTSSTMAPDVVESSPGDPIASVALGYSYSSGSMFMLFTCMVALLLM